MTRLILDSAFRSAAAAWAGAKLDAETFARKAAQLDVRDEDLEARASDLYLAWACAEGDAAALAHFERAFLTQVDLYVRRLGLEAHVVDELRQGLRIHLLVAESGGEPRVGKYSGRGPLGAWVRIVAVRL